MERQKYLNEIQTQKEDFVSDEIVIAYTIYSSTILPGDSDRRTSNGRRGMTSTVEAKTIEFALRQGRPKIYKQHTIKKNVFPQNTIDFSNMIGQI